MHTNGDKDPLLGQLVAGRFLVQHQIGKGGVGRVYRACQVDLDRPVALKVLHEHTARERDQVLRFHHEARIASRLNHPACVTVYDFGEWSGQLYLVMELLEGQTLAKLVRREHPLHTERIVRLLSQVCDGLAAAHDAGLLHRDLKTDNILVTKRPDGTEQAKIVDFGLAIHEDTPPMERLTQDGSIFGTPAFMSPEQCRGMPLDARSDLYSLGIILYEMLTGTVPFEADNPVEIMTHQMLAEPEPPSQRVPEQEVHPALEALTMSALSKLPDDRPPSARAFRDALMQALPTGVDPSHRLAVSPLDRIDRADRAGIPPNQPHAQRHGKTSAADLPILVVTSGRTRANTMSSLLTANGIPFLPTKTVEHALKQAGQVHPAAVLVDIGHDSDQAWTNLERLGRVLIQGKFLDAPVVVMGPEDDIDLMERAITLGVLYYVPQTTAVDRLPKILRRVRSRAAKQRHHEPDHT